MTTTITELTDDAMSAHLFDMAVFSIALGACVKV
jgi:hypothetical protein